MRKETLESCEPCLGEAAHEVSLRGSDLLSRGFSLPNARQVGRGWSRGSQQGLQLCAVMPPDAPRDVVLSSFRDSRVSSTAVVQCTVDSEPPAELALSRDGKVLATSPGVHGLASGTGHVQVARNALRLQVQDVPSGDKDTYVCTAHNFLGSVSTTGQLQGEGEWAKGAERGLGHGGAPPTGPG